MQGLSTDFVIQALYSNCKRPVYKKHQGVYNAECCICNEGRSAGQKRRLFYFPKEKYFYCFNCNQSWTELNWLQKVTHKQYYEILKDSNTHTESSEITGIDLLTDTAQQSFEIPTIPPDSVNILDDAQCNFYVNDLFKNKLITKAKQYCEERRLFTAVNRVKSLYISFNDFVHKGRLIIPFYSELNKIESYQSRSIDSDTYPKYLTKIGEKCLFGENTIDYNIPYVFVFEGPIDAMFVKNSVAMGGANVTERQDLFLKKCLGQEIIYVYDNDKNNKEMTKKIKKVIQQNKKIFIWPKEMQKYKDVNEVCCSLALDELPYKFIAENSKSGIEALLNLKI